MLILYIFIEKTLLRIMVREIFKGLFKITFEQKFRIYQNLIVTVCFQGGITFDFST